MKSVLLGIVGIGITLTLVWAASSLRQGAGEHGTDPELVARLQALEARFQDLERRLDAVLDQARAPLTVASGAAEARAPVERPVPREGPPDIAAARDARWYLEQYVRSFDEGGEGSEYYRLVVDTHVLEVIPQVCGLIREPGRPLPLRLSLVRMLGKVRLRGDTTVLTALLDIVRQNGAENLAMTSLQVWSKLAGVRDLAGLEEFLWRIASVPVRKSAVRALLQVAGEQANATIVRLLGSAPDDAAAQFLIASIDGSDLEAALAAFRLAAQRTQPVRLTGAQRIGEFDGEPFRNFVEDWLRVESDAAVIAALGGARTKQKAGSGWSAMQAVGPPDANPLQDDPKAWAPRDPEMGLQWLELEYASADRCSGARIFEVCSAGAVAEVRAKDPSGAWHTLWAGTTSATAKGPLELAWAATEYAVRTLRIVLDTDRTPGWNEVDAVEFVGPAGRRYAVRATASSTYAQNVSATERTSFPLGSERFDSVRTKR